MYFGTGLTMLQVKQGLRSIIINFMNQLPKELLNSLKLRILRNLEILGKF